MPIDYSKPLKRVGGQIVPQGWNEELQDWEVIEVSNGAYRIQSTVYVSEDYFSGSGDLTKEFTETMHGLVVSNDSEPGAAGAADMNFTVHGKTRKVKAGEVYEGYFKPFNSMSINSTVPWRVEALQAVGGAPVVEQPVDTTAPDNVTNLATSNVTAVSLTLVWTASASNDCIGYDVYRGTTLIGSVTGTTYNVTGLSQSTQYTFTVKAKDAANNIASGTSTIITTAASSDTTPPANVTNLTPSNLAQTSVTLTWTASVSSDVASYDIFNGSTFLANVTSTTYNVNGLSAATTYTFVVKAKDTSGNTASGTSINVTTAGAIPATPTGLAATAGNAQVALTWIAVSEATGYKVYRGGTLLASPTTNSYTDTTAVNGTTYSYSVSAVNGSGESAQSSAVNATPAAPVVAPVTPTGLAATAGDTQVSLTWNVVSGATGYKVYKNGSLLASPTTNSHTETGLTNGVMVNYTVSAVNVAGESAQTSAVSATPAAPAGHVTNGLVRKWDNLTNQVSFSNDGTYVPATGNFTFSATLKPKNFLNIFSQFTIGEANAFRFYLQDNSRLQLNMWGTDNASPSYPIILGSNALTDQNAYYHVTLVKDDTGFHTYINNVLEAESLTTTYAINNSAEPIRIGDPSCDIKNAVYYNRALTSTERTQNYNNLV